MKSVTYRSILLSVLMITSSLAGCLGDEANDADEIDVVDPIPVFGSVMVSTYHVGELVKAVAGDNVVMDYMSQDNIPVHDYEPSAADLIRLQEADVFFYHGLNLEPWVDATLASLGSDAPPSFMTHTMPSGEITLDYESLLVADLCELMNDGPFESTTLGMLSDDHDDHDDHDDLDDHDDDHSDDEDDHDDHGDEIEADGDEEAFDYDPHSWLDPLSFKEQANLVMMKLTLTFPDGADVFADNYEAYSSQLTQLDDSFEAAFGEQGTCVSGGHDKTIVANHNAYSYISVRYDIDIMTVHGLDPEGEPSPAEVAEVVEHIKDEGITVLFVEEYTDQTAVQSIVEETGVEVQILYTMEMRPSDSEDDYMSMMNKNLGNIVSGIGC